MSSARRLRPPTRAILGLTASLALSVACGKQTPPPQAPSAEQSTAAPETKTAPPAQEPRPAITYYSADATIHGLDDIMVAADKIAASWASTVPMGSRELASMLLVNFGFRASFLEQLDLAGPITAHFDLPHNDQYLDQHFDVALSFSSKQPAALVEALPENVQVTAKGANAWTATFDDLTFHLNAGADFLGIARSENNLARAAQDHSRPLAPNGKRIRFALSQLSDEQRKDIAESLPVPLRGAVQAVVHELQEVALEIDIGSERAHSTSIHVKAPLAKLALPIGQATTEPSKLARHLPGDAAFVSQFIVGDPSTTMAQLQSLVAEAPEPFAKPLKDAQQALSELASGVAREVIVAFYVNAKGQSTILVGADLKAPDAAQAQVDRFWAALTQSFQAHIDLVGNSPDDKYRVKYKNKGVRLGGVASQSLEVTIPKRVAKELQPGGEFAMFSPFFSGRGSSLKLESYSAIHDQFAVMALGSGAKSVLTEALSALAKDRDAKNNVESNGGLTAARELTQGCQICGYVDPLAFLRAAAIHAAAESGRSKELKSALRDFSKIKMTGLISGSSRLGVQDGEIAFTVPTTLLYPAQEEAQKFRKFLESLQGLDDPIEPKGSDSKRAKKG